MGKRGPQPIKIDWDQVIKLISLQLTQKDVAFFFGISVDTLENACKRDLGEKLSDFWAKKESLGKVRLRKAQFDIIERGGPGAATLAIYLDKRFFGDPAATTQGPSNGSEKIEVQAVKKSFEQFCIDAGYPKPFQQQIEYNDFMLWGGYKDHPEDPDEPHMGLGSRGYGKTDYCTILGVAYKLYLDPEYRVLIITKSAKRNKQICQEIARCLKANGIELATANTSEIKIAGIQGKELNVEMTTIKASLRGRHPDLILMDDPVTEDDTSEAQRKTVKDKYDEAYKLCKNIGLIGQPAHKFDLYADLRGKIKTLEMPWGSIPELDPDLEAMKMAGISEASIEMSYHLRIPKKGSAIFANLKYIDRFPRTGCVAFIDPSDGGDGTAMSLLTGIGDGIAVKGFNWELAWFHCVDDWVKIAKEHNIKKIAFEINATGSDPINQLRKVFAPLGIAVVPIYSTTPKHSTIVSAGAMAHMIFLAKDSDKTYTDQTEQYEYRAKKDDCPDSLARGLQWLGFLNRKK